MTRTKKLSQDEISQIAALWRKKEATVTLEHNTMYHDKPCQCGFTVAKKMKVCQQQSPSNGQDVLGNCQNLYTASEAVNY